MTLLLGQLENDCYGTFPSELQFLSTTQPDDTAGMIFCTPHQYAGFLVLFHIFEALKTLVFVDIVPAAPPNLRRGAPIEPRYARPTWPASNHLYLQASGAEKVPRRKTTNLPPNDVLSSKIRSKSTFFDFPFFEARHALDFPDVWTANAVRSAHDIFNPVAANATRGAHFESKCTQPPKALQGHKNIWKNRVLKPTRRKRCGSP